jgi:hypothetical protein
MPYPNHWNEALEHDSDWGWRDESFGQVKCAGVARACRGRAPPSALGLPQRCGTTFVISVQWWTGCRAAQRCVNCAVLPLAFPPPCRHPFLSSTPSLPHSLTPSNLALSHWAAPYDRDIRTPTT